MAQWRRKQSNASTMDDLACRCLVGKRVWHVAARPFRVLSSKILIFRRLRLVASIVTCTVDSRSESHRLQEADVDVDVNIKEMEVEWCRTVAGWVAGISDRQRSNGRTADEDEAMREEQDSSHTRRVSRALAERGVKSGRLEPMDPTLTARSRMTIRCEKSGHRFHPCACCCC